MILTATLSNNRIATRAGRLTVYNFDASTREYLFTSEEFLPQGVGLPANACLDAPGPDKAGFAKRRTKDFTAWEYVIDHRGEHVYSTLSGEKIVISALGDYPANTTTQAPSTPFDVWHDNQWVTDKTAQRASANTENAIHQFTHTPTQEKPSAPYFTVADEFGRTGPGLSAWYQHGEFGTRDARVSELGLHTTAATLNADGIGTARLGITTHAGPDILTDSDGRVRFIRTPQREAETANISEIVTLTEPTSIDLWVMGGAGWQRGRTHNTLLSPQGGQITRSSTVECQPLLGAITVPMQELSVMTLAMVVQVPQVLAGNRVMLYSFAHDAKAPGLRCWFARRDDNALALMSLRKARNAPLTGITLAPSITPGDFIFFAHVVALNNDKENYQVMYTHAHGYRKLREFDVIERTLSTESLSLGNAHEDVAGWKSEPTVFAEFCAFAQALNGSALTELFYRAKMRHGVRGITVK